MCDLCKHDIRTKEKTSKDDKEGYNVYSADQKVLFLYYLQVRLYKDAKAARLSGVTERTGQQWARILMAEPKTPVMAACSAVETSIVIFFKQGSCCSGPKFLINLKKHAIRIIE